MGYRQCDYAVDKGLFAPPRQGTDQSNPARFVKIDMHCGTITDARAFQEARKTGTKLLIDCGSEVVIRIISSQITPPLPTRENLAGRKIIAVVNFPPRKITQLVSEELVLGFARSQRQGCSGRTGGQRARWRAADWTRLPSADFNPSSHGL